MQGSVAVVALDVSEELEQLDEDQACDARSDVVVDVVADVVEEDGMDGVDDVVGGGEDAAVSGTRVADRGRWVASLGAG